MTGFVRMAVGGAGPLAHRLHPLVERAQDCLYRNAVGAEETGVPYLRAGGGYPDPWTRDAAINVWQAAAWLAPAAAERTLRMVCEQDGSRVVWDDQWWDQVIWLLGARELALVTRDTGWAAWAAAVGNATLQRLDERRLDPGSGLYRGPAVMADGITGYPPSLHDPARPAHSFVLDHPATHQIAALSTNALYVAAMRSLADLVQLCGGTPAPWRERAARLTESIRRRFRAPGGEWGYLRVDGDLTGEQEGLGLALAILADVLTLEEGRAAVRGARREPFGLPAVWPAFPDVPPERFGRHGTALWPMVMGVWSQAVAHLGDADGFGRELDALCRLFENTGLEFYEVYSPTTGMPDGGWQAGREWRSEADQTWSATTLLGTVLHGVAGLRPTPEGLEVRPCLPPGADGLELRGVPWAGGRFDLVLHGAGSVVESMTIDGRPWHGGPDAGARPPLIPHPMTTLEVTCHEEERHP